MSDILGTEEVTELVFADNKHSSSDSPPRELLLYTLVYICNFCHKTTPSIGPHALQSFFVCTKHLHVHMYMCLCLQVVRSRTPLVTGTMHSMKK